MSASKHYLSDPIEAVHSALKSLPLTNPSLVVDLPNKIVYRNPASIKSPKNVSVVCGGGSGHEPGFVGFVGEGVLTACVAGTIFASPGAEQIRTCLQHRLPSESQGILVIATNYTGDVLNFGMAVEKARALGKEVQMVVVGDDVGVGRAKGGKVGRRGLSGTALVVKICGALAEMGGSLSDCASVGSHVVENMVSLGASLNRVHIPGRGIEEAKEEEARLGPGLVEVGMGIHNEPGCEKIKTDLPGLIKTMLAQMLDQNDKDRHYLKIGKGDELLLLINNFGGVSTLEIGAITNEVSVQLEQDYGLKPKRVVQGNLFGSLDGPGFIVTVLKLFDTRRGPGKQILDLIDAPANAVGWPKCVTKETWETEYPEAAQKTDEAEERTESSNITIDPAIAKEVLEPALKRLIEEEPAITKYDTVVGDGDCGVGLKRGAEAMLSALSNFNSTDAMDFFALVCRTVENSMDGTSGALYAIFLNALAAHVRKCGSGSSPKALDHYIMSQSLSIVLMDMRRYTPAEVGDRTLMDALIPFINVLKETGDIKMASEIAKNRADLTKGMKASLGRSVYVGGKGFEEVPDPGAYGLSVFLEVIADKLVELDGSGRLD